MPAKKKKFIDKKNAVTFHLVHRSQKDPLQADDEAPQHVLLPQESSEVRKEEQREFGVFYDDEYDYMQHLKDTDELCDVAPHVLGVRLDDPSARGSKLQFPSKVFGSELETSEGLLNKAVPLIGPQPDWDPDIVAALDEDFEFDDPNNQLDDDFMIHANTEGNEEIKRRPDEEYDGSDEQGSDVSSNGGNFQWEDNDFEDEETKSRFTQYSMTSSVIRRNEGLTLLDDRFERLYEQYDESEIGALDHEEIQGRVGHESAVLNSIMEEFEKDHKEIKLKDAIRKAENVNLESSSESEKEIIYVDEEKPQEKWDCESILSTYSNLYNHPKTIEEPNKVKPLKLTARAELPTDVLPNRGPTRKQLEKEEHQQMHISLANTYRPSDETTEERKNRKMMVKQERKERRQEKKANKQAFKDEHKKQEKELYNVTQNYQGMKIQ